MRASGRTTRMLEAANVAFAKGNKVCVFAVNHVQAREFQQILGSEMRVRVPSRQFDWVRLCEPGMSRECLVFIDHFALEIEADEIDREIDRILSLRTSGESVELRKSIPGLSLLMGILRDKSHEFDLSAEQVRDIKAAMDTRTQVWLDERSVNWDRARPGADHTSKLWLPACD